MVFDPELLMPLPLFKQHLATLLDEIKATPLQLGVSEIRIPSERAFAERERRCNNGFSMEQRIYERLGSI